MALNLKLANELVNLQADSIISAFNNGYLRIYGGTQPLTADTSTAETLLAELRFHATTSFTRTSDGVLTAGAITSDASANASGTATWFRCLKSDGTTPLMDGSVGTATSNLILNSVAISAGATVSVTSFVHTVTK